MTSHSRIDGYAPIEDYAVLSDGRTSALIAKDGRVDWWPVPTLDSLPICAALLDEARGGYVALRPVSAFDVERSYVKATNVLASTFTTEEGSVSITTALTMAETGRLPWTELVWRIEGLRGCVEMEWRFRFGTEFETAVATTFASQGIPVVSIGTHTVATLFDGEGDIEVSSEEMAARFRVEPGARVTFALVATEREPVSIPSITAVDARIDATQSNWSRWSSQIDATAQWRDAVVRSALVLKSLLAEYTGAIAAAATTSLPERIGGDKNWDYRFSWVRDSSFAIDAFINLGLVEEIHGAVGWLLRAIGRNGPKLHVFYSLSGAIANGETRLDASGYRDSQPVRSGNGAANQLQLGNYGDVFDTILRYVREGNVLDVSSRALLADLADRTCDEWHQPDSGIWELPEINHYTISKIGCWVALDRALKLSDQGQLEGDVVRWRDEREKIRNFVIENCWSSTKNSYTSYAGTEDLDASVLLSARTGFDVGHRLVGTIEAVSRELRDGPLVYRYTGADKQEGAFVACSFWMVEALAATNRRQEALRLMDDAVKLSNDVGVLSEQIDPRSGRFLGNVPQALSHLSLINAAHSLTFGEGLL